MPQAWPLCQLSKHLMADNYLERRMDDYRNGRLSRQAAPRPHRPEALAVHLHGIAVAPLVKALRQLGVRVSFSGMSQSCGAALAQSTGSTFCPLPLADALRHMSGSRGQIDALVITEACGDMPSGMNVVALTAEAPASAHRVDPCLPAEAQARLVTALAKISAPVEIMPRNGVL